MPRGGLDRLGIYARRVQQLGALARTRDLVDRELDDARALVGVGEDVQHRVAASFEEHGLPSLPVNVTLTGYDRQTTRELS